MQLTKIKKNLYKLHGLCLNKMYVDIILTREQLEEIMSLWYSTKPYKDFLKLYYIVTRKGFKHPFQSLNG